MNARRQAEDYAKALPLAEGWPPFLIVCDVGHCFEIYADFSGQGKNYAQFPDRQGFRIYLEDLKRRHSRAASPDMARSAQTGPDQDRGQGDARHCRASRENLQASRRGKEEKALRSGSRGAVSHALPVHDVRRRRGIAAEGQFSRRAQKMRRQPALFPRLVGQLWEAMDTGGFSFALERDVKQIQRLSVQESHGLSLAARRDWRTLRGGESRLERGRASHFRNAARAGAQPRRAAQARRALHAARLCGAACRGDRTGAVEGRMGECPGDGGKQAQRRRRQGRGGVDTRRFTKGFATRGFSTPLAALETFFTCRSN